MCPNLLKPAESDKNTLLPFYIQGIYIAQVYKASTFWDIGGRQTDSIQNGPQISKKWKKSKNLQK